MALDMQIEYTSNFDTKQESAHDATVKIFMLTKQVNCPSPSKVQNIEPLA